MVSSMQMPPLIAKTMHLRAVQEEVTAMKHITRQQAFPQITTVWPIILHTVTFTPSPTHTHIPVPGY